MIFNEGQVLVLNSPPARAKVLHGRRRLLVLRQVLHKRDLRRGRRDDSRGGPHHHDLLSLRRQLLEAAFARASWNTFATSRGYYECYECLGGYQGCGKGEVLGVFGCMRGV